MLKHFRDCGFPGQQLKQVNDEEAKPENHQPDRQREVARPEEFAELVARLPDAIGEGMADGLRQIPCQFTFTLVGGEFNDKTR